MFALPNLVSLSTEPCTPWTFKAPIPDEVRTKAGKSARDKWISDPTTQHQVYSPWEGVNDNGRIRKATGADAGNPPFRLHALVVDLDAELQQSELEAGIQRLGEFIPNYYERTLSGNARLLWLLEKPVTVPGWKFAVELLERILHKLRLELVGAGFDRPAFLDPARYYTNSGEWFSVDLVRRIPHALVQGWVMETAERHNWKKDAGALEIPLPIVAEELGKKYPSFTSWPGDFALDSQGPTFWVPESTSPKSAIVKPTGIFTFSGHAHKNFFSWADLLGAQFADGYKTELLGKAVEGIFHDGRQYWRKDGLGDWKPFAKEDLVNHLHVKKGLSTTKRDGQPSETNRALSHIQDYQGISGAAPFVYQPEGVITRQGLRFLNTHTRRPMSPAGEASVWGPGGKFPFLSQFFDGLFHPDSKPCDPLRYWLAWLARFYRGAYEQLPESGQNCFLLGGAGVGKTFLSQGILPRLMGGSADAEQYLLGKTNFNSDLFQVGLWTIDDNSATVSRFTHEMFSSLIKKMAANTTFTFAEKFRVNCVVEWLGRVVVTANDDEKSASIVPDLEISILDKLDLFRVTHTPPVVFLTRREMTRILDDELPYLARWLLDYRIPDDLVGSARFGVRAYHDEMLLKTAKQSSHTAGFQELVWEFLEAYFAERAGVTEWRGTAIKLAWDFNKIPGLGDIARAFSANAIGLKLASLKSVGLPGYEIEIDGTGANRNYLFRKFVKSAAVEMPRADSKFAKQGGSDAS